MFYSNRNILACKNYLYMKWSCYWNTKINFQFWCFCILLFPIVNHHKRMVGYDSIIAVTTGENWRPEFFIKMWCQKIVFICKWKQFSDNLYSGQWQQIRLRLVSANINCRETGYSQLWRLQCEMEMVGHGRRNEVQYRNFDEMI